MNWEELLKEAHREPLDAAHYEAVRARVLAEISARKRPRWLPAMLLAAATLLILFFPKPARTPVGSGVQPAAAVPGGVGVTPEQPKLASVKPRRPKGRRQPKRAGPTEPILVKLLTDDPNIVIYWIADAKGD